ncbi:MAG: plasmid pRiA4b ORF-3 family protein, partial [Acetobacteraceae bacterium]|nr:plasmid pRiA4b ORF-3 family protein [Acetobacteraceae bacterium]
QGEPGIGYPRYVAGEHNTPPEDCGGIPGLSDKLDIAADPSHPDHDEIKEWLDDYDPETADELQIKITLGRIAKRRNAAQARVKKPAS